MSNKAAARHAKFHVARNRPNRKCVLCNPRRRPRTITLDATDVTALTQFVNRVELLTRFVRGLIDE